MDKIEFVESLKKDRREFVRLFNSKISSSSELEFIDYIDDLLKRLGC